jgi:hypothetical protein
MITALYFTFNTDFCTQRVFNTQEVMHTQRQMHMQKQGMSRVTLSDERWPNDARIKVNVRILPEFSESILREQGRKAARSVHAAIFCGCAFEKNETRQNKD